MTPMPEDEFKAQWIEKAHETAQHELVEAWFQYSARMLAEGGDPAGGRQALFRVWILSLQEAAKAIKAVRKLYKRAKRGDPQAQAEFAALLAESEEEGEQIDQKFLKLVALYRLGGEILERATLYRPGGGPGLPGSGGFPLTIIPTHRRRR